MTPEGSWNIPKYLPIGGSNITSHTSLIPSPELVTSNWSCGSVHGWFSICFRESFTTMFEHTILTIQEWSPFIWTVQLPFCCWLVLVSLVNPYYIHIFWSWFHHHPAMTFPRHGDPSDHTPFGLLNLVFRGLTLGTFSNLLERWAADNGDFLATWTWTCFVPDFAGNHGHMWVTNSLVAGKWREKQLLEENRQHCPKMEGKSKPM